MKRILSVFLVAVIVLSIIPISGITVSAAGLTLAQLKEKFP